MISYLSSIVTMSLSGTVSEILSVITARHSYASMVLGVVIVSVCPSQACFVANPKNLPVIFLYHMKGQSF